MRRSLLARLYNPRTMLCAPHPVYPARFAQRPGPAPTTCIRRWLEPHLGCSGVQET